MEEDAGEDYTYNEYIKLRQTLTEDDKIGGGQIKCKNGHREAVGDSYAKENPQA